MNVTVPATTLQGTINSKPNIRLAVRENGFTTGFTIIALAENQQYSHIFIKHSIYLRSKIYHSNYLMALAMNIYGFQ
ncbi:MAG: hypothetical protein HWE26_12625 [Alteromonadaceae bacterium]|nr:hypothetical protein [Alteromonadaceae bacterium]